MKIEQLYTKCLAQGAYYIESEGEVAIIDPLRETQQYIDQANENGAKIKYIFETHFHADFVSGHIDLAQKTNATIVFGPGASTSYNIHVAKDNEEFKIGKLTLKVLHTPGHTLESVTYLLLDENGNEHAIFSGDTLFLGDVGRPDLAIKSDLTKEDLAGMLFDSLRNRIMTLPDDIIVYPAHGAGSACGKNLSKETTGILGDQKATNYALRADMTKEEFIKEVLDGIAPPPQYFSKNALMNKNGYDSFSDVLAKGNNGLNASEFKALSETESALILDVRPQADFIKKHIPNSMFIGLNGQFAPWVGALIKDIKQPILLITPEGKEEEAITRLSRVGYDNTLGYLKGGIDTWEKEGYATDNLESITADTFENLNSGLNLNMLDVRKDGEYNASHLKDAQHVSLDFIFDKLNDLDKSKKYYVYCGGGYRSVIAISILKSKGFTNLVDLAGGFAALKQTQLPKTDFVCPSNN